MSKQHTSRINNHHPGSVGQPMQAQVVCLLLIVVLFIGGPWACLVHCFMLDTAHHHHHAHVTQAPVSFDTPLHSADPCLLSMQAATDSGPSALTIGVVLANLAVLYLLVAAFHSPVSRVAFCSLAIPPPRRPPRASN